MANEKSVRKIKRIILQVLGVLSILQIASYLPLFKHYILSNYINRVNVRFLVDIYPSAGRGAGYLIYGVLFVLLVLYVVGIIMLMYTSKSRKWQKRMNMAYRLLIIFTGIVVVYLLAGIFFYPSHQKSQTLQNGEMLSASMLCASYAVLFLFFIYKKWFAKEKIFDALNFALVVAMVLAFLGGGILIPGASPKQTLLFGGAQVGPLVFLAYFEFIYKPVLLTRKKHRHRRKHKTS